MSGSRRRRDVLSERWFVEMEHPSGYVAKVCLKWSYSGHGIYSAVVDAIEWDLFTPPEMQDRLTEEMRKWNIRSLLPLQRQDSTSSSAPW